MCHAEKAAQGGRGRQWVEEAGRGTRREACRCVCPSRDRFVRSSAELAAAALPLAASCAQRAPAPVPTRSRRRRRCRCASAGYTSSSSELMCKICCAASSGGSRAAPDSRCGSSGSAPHPLRAPRRCLHATSNLRATHAPAQPPVTPSAPLRRGPKLTHSPSCLLTPAVCVNSARTRIPQILSWDAGGRLPPRC